MGLLLSDLKIKESLSKACGPSTRMIFLGIIVDTIKMTLELDQERLLEMQELLVSWENKTHATLKQV